MHSVALVLYNMHYVHAVHDFDTMGTTCFTQSHLTCFDWELVRETSLKIGTIVVKLYQLAT